MDSESLRPVARTLLRAYQVRSARSRNLADALAKGTLSSWKDDELICEENGPANTMFVILKGSVRVLKKDIKGVQQELAVLPSPCIIGQMGLVDGSPRSATCKAIDDVGALSIDIDTYNTLLTEASPAGSAFRHLMLSTMTSQLSTANQKIRDLITEMEQGVAVVETANQEPKESKESKVKRVVKAASAEKKTRPPSSERLLKIAGVLDGWDVHTEDIDLDVELFEDDDMKRTREAREISKKHRW